MIYVVRVSGNGMKCLNAVFPFFTFVYNQIKKSKKIVVKKT